MRKNAGDLAGKIPTKRAEGDAAVPSLFDL